MSTILKPSTQDQADTPSICHDTNVSPTWRARPCSRRPSQATVRRSAAVARVPPPPVSASRAGSLHRPSRLPPARPRIPTSLTSSRDVVVLLVDHGRPAPTLGPTARPHAPGLRPVGRPPAGRADLEDAAREPVARRSHRGHDDRGVAPGGDQPRAAARTRVRRWEPFEHLWARLAQAQHGVVRPRLHVQQQTICEVAAEFAMSRRRPSTPEHAHAGDRPRLCCRPRRLLIQPAASRSPHCSGAASRLRPTVFAVSRTPKRSRPVEHVAGST